MLVKNSCNLRMLACLAIWAGSGAVGAAAVMSGALSCVVGDVWLMVAIIMGGKQTRYGGMLACWGG